MTTEQCAATKTSPTAEGDVEVRCTKPRGHDGKHEAWITVFPVRWADAAPGAASATTA